MSHARQTGSLRVGSSMVEQRPFKALVAGSSPAQPKFSNGMGLHLRGHQDVAISARPKFEGTIEE
ncbi:MAG: hypothetical protein JWO45_1994 [Spartobacteria bacterium]|nr:hypothetical protein [Spartobacteria bacterium]